MALALAACAPPPRVAAVPDAILVDADGRAVDARALVASSPFTVITFFSATCPTQAAHDARLAHLYARYSARRVQFVAVDSEVGATRERDASEAKRRGYRFPILVDADAVLAHALGADTASFAVVVDACGRVLYSGGIDSDRTHLTADATHYLANALDDLLAGRAPRVTERKSLGCALRLTR